MVDPNSILPIVDILLSIPAVGPYIPVVATVSTIASVVAGITKTPKQGTFTSKLYKWFIEFPALITKSTKDQG
jgi:hypothetical protein